MTLKTAPLDPTGCHGGGGPQVLIHGGMVARDAGGRVKVLTSLQDWTDPGPRPRALVVDDDGDVCHSYRLALAHAGFEVLEARTGAAGIDLAVGAAPDVVLLDANLPDMDGVDVVHRLRQDTRTDAVPILMVSADDGIRRKVAGLQQGANDYLTKPVSPAELIARAQAAVDRRARRRDRIDASLASRRRLATEIALLDPSSPWDLLVSSLRSTLANVLDFTDVTVELLPAPQAVPHDADAGSTPSGSNPGSTHVHLHSGGLTFAVLTLTGVDDPDETRAVLDDVAPQLSTLLVAKAGDERSRRAERATIHHLVSTPSIIPVFQPIVDLRSGVTVAFEGLSRFTDGTPPIDHFRRATRVGLAVDLELHALTSILEAAADLPAHAGLSVNLSATTLLETDLRPLLSDVGRLISLEITEHEHIDDYAAVSRAMARLPGVQLSVDDTGSGYASLRHVYELRPAAIKLDRDWVRGIAEDPVRQAMVTGMCAFAASLDADLVGEGIEDEEDRDALAAIGVSHGQGYFFARPAPAASFATLTA